MSGDIAPCICNTDTRSIRVMSFGPSQLYPNKKALIYIALEAW